MLAITPHAIIHSFRTFSLAFALLMLYSYHRSEEGENTMIKTYAKYDAEKKHTLPITVDGKTRWITPELALAIEGWKQAALADYVAKSGDTVTNSHRIFVIYQSPRFDYVLSVTDAAFDGPNLSVVASVLSISDVTKQYDADPRWQRIVAGINPISDLIA